MKTKTTQNWSWERWCSFLRVLARKEVQAEVKLVIGLMELEQRREVWEGRGVGFAKLICHPSHLALPLSPTRYERIKDAINRYGEEEILRLGVAFADSVSKLREEAIRNQFRSEAEQWIKEFGRPMSATAARSMLMRIAPPDNTTRTFKTAAQRLRDAQNRIGELERELEQKETALGKALAELRRAKSLLRKYGIDFSHG